MTTPDNNIDQTSITVQCSKQFAVGCACKLRPLLLVTIALASFTGAEALFTPAPTHLNAVGLSNYLVRREIHSSKAVTSDAAIHLGQHKIVQSSHTRLSAIPTNLEDMIFTSQNAASTLANTVISSDASNAKSLLLLYAAGLLTSFSPCSLGLLPITVSYITTAANERNDRNTMLPTIAFALGLALVFTALGVSASILGGVFGGGEDTLSSLLLAAVSSLVSVFMGLQLLELIEIPLPSLDFRLRSAVLEGGKQNDSLFDADGGLIVENLSNKQSLNEEKVNGDYAHQSGDDFAVLLRTFLLGGTSALVASPCATPVLASLLAYLAMASTSISSGNELAKGAGWMLSYTIGYSTPLLLVGATGGQALVNLQNMKSGDGLGSLLGRYITPMTGGVLIVFGMNGFLVALLGDPSLAGLAPIIE